PASIRRSDHDVASLGMQDPPESGQRMVRHAVENHVITWSALGEILFGVVNHPSCSERSQQIHILRAAYPGHFGGKGLGDLDGKRDRKSTRLNSSHVAISYAVFCLKKK